MDFIRVGIKEEKDGTRTYFPALQALESQDLVIRGGQFVAIWDAETNLYSRMQSHIPDIVDRAFTKMVGNSPRGGDVVKKMRNFDNQLFTKLMSLIRNVGDMGPELDQHLIFADQEPTKADAATFKMSYSLSDAPCPVWNEICDTLYDPEQRVKFEYAMGSILAGQAMDIQKFYVFFGPPGAGKGTIMNIIEMVFQGHTAAFDSHAMAKADAQFSLEPFKNNPLVAIDQDGDLSRIELNKNINSIVSHDKLLINAKGKNLFEIIPRSTLFIGSNDPVKISNRKSGLFRRLVDIQPSGRLIDETRYHGLMEAVKYELGSIAKHCMDVYHHHGPTYLSSYRANEMMYRTNDIFNFVEDNRLILQHGINLKQAHKMYAAWCEETDTRNIYKQYQFRDLLMDYFKEFHHEIMIDGVRHRSWFKDLRELEKFSWKGLSPKPTRNWLELDVVESPFDRIMADQPAQLASKHGTPKKAWSEVTTTLKDIDTSKEHFVKVPENIIIVDFDLTDENGEKSLVKNLEAAALWPPTNCEVSRSGAGLHLAYEYVGDVTKVGTHHSDGIEIKTLLGNASLRRRLNLNNGVPISSISSGLPLKEERVIEKTVMQTEKGLRALILKALNKDVHAGTKSNMDFIKHVTDEAYNTGVVYNIEDMWDDILAFAMGSTHQRTTSIEIAMSVHLRSEADHVAGPDLEDAPIADFDLEVYPNLFAVAYMMDMGGEDDQVVKMINPGPEEIEHMFKLRLVGYNNRNYDNHILWAASLGADNAALYDLSQRIIAENDRRALYGAAYDLAYADLYDLASNDNKKSLKKWEIDLGLPHMEMDLPWNEPVPEDRVMDVMEYLENDVRSTRAVRKHIDADVRARQILAQLSGLKVCNTNKQHTEMLIFGKQSREANPALQYTELKEMFPGYEFDQFKPGKEKSTYKGEKVGEGGWVKAKPGYYEKVGVLDIASMHPTSIVELNLFGEYTDRFKLLLDIRLSIKKGDYDTAIDLDERLAPYLGNKDSAKGLSDALKIVINSVYGLTAASFPNQFKDPRNKDNIVAKRGALFMVDLVEYVESEGYEVVHVKTDSIKIPNITPEIVDKVTIFGQKYGYNFEHETTYDKFCLVNDAVYVAIDQNGWTATGAQFKHPVVFKTLFTKEELEARDFVEVKQVAKGHMYLVSEETDVRQFVGRFGALVPVHGGRRLLRIDGDKEHAVTGTKDHLWELDTLAIDGDTPMDVDFSYFQNLIDAARVAINTHVPYAEFTSA